MIDNKSLEIRIRNLELVLPKERIERAKEKTVQQTIGYAGEKDKAFKELYHAYLSEQYRKLYKNEDIKEGSD